MTAPTAPTTPPTSNPAPDAVEAEWKARLEPKRPHDELPFEELATRYNFLKTSDRRAMLVRLVLNELRDAPSPKRVLDIGAGKGIGRQTSFQSAIAQQCNEMWGVEPDKGVVRTDGVFAQFQHALMETAELPENAFDVAYAFMVMEHVADPAAFLSAVRRCLKPGGVFLFMTPNLRHYFTRSANLLKAMKLDELTLRVLRRQSDLDEYHYPVVYRFNTPSQIDRAAEQSGMSRPGYVYLESDGPRPYMRGPLVPIYHMLMYKRSVWKNPRVLLTLTGRIAKPMTGTDQGAAK